MSLKKSKTNRKNKQLLSVRNEINKLESDIRGLGSPSDYANIQNYKNKVNELRNQYGRGLLGRKDLNDHMNDLKAKESSLKEAVGNRYVQKPGFRLGELLISDTKLSPLYSKEGGIEYKLNPNYVEGEDTTSETALKNKAALEAGAIEREQNEWGEGGEPTASQQLSISGADIINGINNTSVSVGGDQSVPSENTITAEQMKTEYSDPSDRDGTGPEVGGKNQPGGWTPSHPNMDVARPDDIKGAAAQIQDQLLEAGFKQSELNALQDKHKAKYGDRKGLLSIFKGNKKKGK